jgi:hypothetical protein
MPKRIDQLSSEQKTRMSSFAREWIERGWRTTPLTEEEWALQADGMRKCYEYAGIPFPSTIVRVSSPMVGAFAAPIANYTIAKLRKHGAVHGAVRGAVGGAVRGAVGGAVGDAVRGAVGDAVHGAVGDAVDGAVRGAVGDAVHGAVRGAVGDAVDGAVRGAVRDAVHGAVRGAVGGAVGGAVRGAVGGAVGDAVDDAVGGAVGDAVDDAVRGAVGDAVDDAVHGAVGGAVDGAVDGAVGDAVGDAVDGAVRGAEAKELLNYIRDNFYKTMGGRTGNGYYYTGPWWESYAAFFRDVAELELPGDLWDRSRALEQADTAGWWWPFKDFIIVCDVPTVMNLEQVAPQGWGSHRLHCDDGPAIAWADGFGLYYWHGRKVPAWAIESPTPELILAEKNTEVRRCAIESLGWPEFIEAAGLRMVGEAQQDPGNPGQDITLYDVPTEIYGDPVRVLVATNGTVERDGSRHTFGLTVPVNMTTPLEAAAWGYGLTADQYATAQRRA